MRLALTIFIFIFVSFSAQAVEFKFADAEKAKEILLAQDDYFNRLSAAEIAIRMNSVTADKTAADLKAQYEANITDWAPEDIAQFEAVLEANWASFERIAHLLPDTVYFIRGTNKLEGGLPHTQANAIIIQDNNPALSAYLFFHETFHVLTRHNADKHASLYGLLGFKACMLNEPAALAATHLTNPDEPLGFDYYVNLPDGDGEISVMPYLYAAYPAFNPEVEGGFPGHFGFGLMQLEVKDGICSPMLNEDGSPILLNPGETPAFFEAIGRNTGYIIHVEETLADNFVLLLLGSEQPLPNPEIPEALGAWIDAQK